MSLSIFVPIVNIISNVSVTTRSVNIARNGTMCVPSAKSKVIKNLR